MSDLSTKRLIAQYEEDAGAPFFGASMFPTGPGDIHTSKTVEIDVRRAGRPIAIAVTDWKSGGNVNTLDLYTNKEFVPPILDEEFVLNSGELMDREFGRSPFESPDFMGHAQRTLRSGVMKMADKIRRTVELQCWQIFQLGVVTLVDSSGNTVYEVDMQMKSTHKASATVDWDETTADPIKDMSAGDELVRKDAKHQIDTWVFGENAFQWFLASSKVQALLDNRRMQLGGIDPSPPGSEDQIYQGYVIINGVQQRLYTYRASYDHPQTGTDTPYVSANNAIGIASRAPRRLTYGGIPRIVPVDSRLSSLGLGSMMSADRGLALTTNAWVDPKGTTITASVATRPLAIPTAIDGHVVINTKVS